MHKVNGNEARLRKRGLVIGALVGFGVAYALIMLVIFDRALGAEGWVYFLAVILLSLTLLPAELSAARGEQDVINMFSVVFVLYYRVRTSCGRGVSRGYILQMGNTLSGVSRGHSRLALVY